MMSVGVLSRESVVDFVADILTRRGAESYLGEAVTMQQHMLQAAYAAERAGADEDLVAAALLHDIGHYTGEFGEDYIAQAVDNRHESAGAHVLDGLFPPVVVDCVRLHVAAKRYLCATCAGYHERLSPSSAATLALQGGPMDADERAAFESELYFREAVMVRLWDDEAKEPAVVTPDFAHYAPLLRRVVEKARP
jgi:phosphonate degradation associated HDIG domain protein